LKRKRIIQRAITHHKPCLTATSFTEVTAKSRLYATILLVLVFNLVKAIPLYKNLADTCATLPNNGLPFSTASTNFAAAKQLNAVTELRRKKKKRRTRVFKHRRRRHKKFRTQECPKF